MVHNSLLVSFFAVCAVYAAISLAFPGTKSHILLVLRASLSRPIALGSVFATVEARKRSLAARARSIIAIRSLFLGSNVNTKYAALLGLVVAASAAVAAPTQIYSNNFEGATPNLAGFNGTLRTSYHSNFSQFLGRYSQLEQASLTILPPADVIIPPPGSQMQYTVTWDLYVIDSWDAGTSIYGDDHWIMTANGRQVYNESFDNWGNPHTSGAPTIGPVHLGYGNTMFDSIYRDLSVTFNGTPGQNLTLNFSSTLLQGVWDESWGIDNIRISYDFVPTPGVASLGALASLAALRRRR